MKPPPWDKYITQLYTPATKEHLASFSSHPTKSAQIDVSSIGLLLPTKNVHNCYPSFTEPFVHIQPIPGKFRKSSNHRLKNTCQKVSVSSMQVVPSPKPTASSPLENRFVQLEKEVISYFQATIHVLPGELLVLGSFVPGRSTSPGCLAG